MSDFSKPTFRLRLALDSYGIKWYDKTVVIKKDESNSKMKYKEVHLEKTSFCLGHDQITGFIGYKKITEDTVEWINYGTPGDPEGYMCFKIFNSNHENKYEYVWATLYNISAWIEEYLERTKN